MGKSAERIEFLSGVLSGAVENNGYGGLTSDKWHCPDGKEAEWYAVMVEREYDDKPESFRVDLDTIAKGIGVISRAVLRKIESGYDKGAEVLHNSKTGERLYLSQEMRRDIMAASAENDAAGSERGGDLDVIAYLAIMECGIYGRVVFG